MSEQASKAEGERPALKTAARLAAVQALYAIDVTGADIEGTMRDFIYHHVPQEAEKPVPVEFDAALFKSIVTGASSEQVKIDELLESALDAKYKLDRLEKILKAIFRAGVSELMSGGVDHAIIINDYVSITHGFFAGKESGLVNAVLDKLAKSMQ